MKTTTRKLTQHAYQMLHRDGDPSRRGTILLLFAAMMVVLFGFVSFTVDYGYMAIVKSELQNTADASALAGVQELGYSQNDVQTAANNTAAANMVAGNPGQLLPGQIETGIYELGTQNFLPTTVNPNAVRVRSGVTDVPLFFAPVIGHKNFSFEAEAIAMTDPREIVFVVDLSGTMNNDTEVAWSPAWVANNRPDLPNPNIGYDFVQRLYDDLDFGTFPGTEQYLGNGLVSQDYNAYARLTEDNGPLTAVSDTHYRIYNSDSESTRKTKLYRWVIDNQIANIMPKARPVPNSRNSTSFTFYSKYLDYMIRPRWVERTWSHPRQGYTWDWVRTPYSQDSDRIYTLSGSSLTHTHFNKIGYRTFVNFLQDFGSDRSPDRDNAVNADPSIGTKTQLSTLSPYCRYHAEDVNGQTFNFPPRTEPMHSCRRSVIRAMQFVKSKNIGVSAAAADRVSVVTFDALDAYHAPRLIVPLTTDYDTAMQAVALMQAVGDRGASTASEAGMNLAKAQFKPTTTGGPARPHASKVLVFLTDGMPNLYESSNSDIDQYIADNPNSDFYTGGDWSAYARNAALMQAGIGLNNNQSTFAIGMGLGQDVGFMDRLARMAGTDKNGQSPRTSGDPAEYESSLTTILEEIILFTGARLVQ